MKRQVWLLLAVSAPWAHAAIFPEQIGSFARAAVTPIKPPDAAFFAELGFKEAELAEYAGPAGRFRVTGWKVADSTAALALYQARRPEGATRSGLAKLAARTPDGFIAAYGNFVFEYAGHVPDSDEFEALLVQLKNVERSVLPTLIQYLPEEDLIPNSERYILGPVALERYLPQVPPSLAAFHLAAEGQQGRYRSPAGEITLTIFSYPAPNMARERQEAFLRLPGAMAKRAARCRRGRADSGPRALRAGHYPPANRPRPGAGVGEPSPYGISTSRCTDRRQPVGRNLVRRLSRTPAAARLGQGSARHDGAAHPRGVAGR
jgi:hypothetical protein